MEGQLTFQNWKGEKWVGRWVGVFYFKWSSHLLVLTKHLSGSTLVQRPPCFSWSIRTLSSDPQVFLPSVEPKLSHFLMPPFLELWTSLTLLLSYQPYYCSECPEGQALWRCSSFLRPSNCCWWDFSSVVRHNLFQPYSLLLLLTCFLVLANTPPTNS